MNQKKRIALTTTFVGLVCGFVLTQQQAAAAATNAPDPITTSMLAPENTAAATSVKPAEPSQNDQPVNRQTSTQKAVTNENSTSETTTQVQNPGSQSTGSMTTTTAAQPNNKNSSATPAPSQKTAAAPNTETISSVNSTNDDTQLVNKVATSKATNTTEPVNSPNNNSTTTASQDPQVETIAQGTWGTSKWEYVHQGNDYILHFHTGTLGTSCHGYNNYNYHEVGSIGASPEVFNGNGQWSDALTQIIIDPGVKANQDSSYLFEGLYHLQKIVGLDNLDTANVTNMSWMFGNCQSVISLDVSKFNTANVTDMSDMFDWCSALTLTSLDVSHFNTANVTNMHNMFLGCKCLTSLDVSNFDTAKVTDMGHMFDDCPILNLDVSHFNTANVTNMAGMFAGYQGTKLDVSNFDTAKVTDMHGMFEGCSGLTSLDLSHFNTASVTNMSWMFSNCTGLTSLDVSKFNTTNVTNMTEMFTLCENLTNLDVNNFNTAKVTDMREMFADCESLTSLDVSHFNTANVTDMSEMFQYCSGLTSLDLSSFNTAKVTYMAGMFQYCSGLTSLDLSSFNTAKVTYMAGMFQYCSGLTSLDLGKFDTINLSDLEGMFRYCNSLNHLILGSKTLLTTDTGLPNVPETGAKISGTNRIVTSPYWIATSGYQQGHKYTSNDLMGLTGRDQVTTYDWDSKPAFTQTTETKTKDRTIVIHQPDGNTKTEIQSVMISRTITLNADGSKTYGNWSSAQWDGYAIPEFAGYTASVSQIPAQTVDGNTEDQTIDVYYAPQEQTVEIQYLANGQIVGTQKITGYTGDTIMPNYHAPQGYEITSLTPATVTIDGTGKQIIQVQVSPKLNDSVEHKTLTRTINLHLPDGTMRVSKQTALLERQVTINAVTGEKIYGAWNTGNWKALNVPTLAGYTASQDQVAAQQVTGADSDQTVDVYYMPNN